MRKMPYGGRVEGGSYNCKRGHLKVSATLRQNNLECFVVTGFVFSSTIGAR